MSRVRRMKRVLNMTDGRRHQQPKSPYRSYVFRRGSQPPSIISATIMHRYFTKFDKIEIHGRPIDCVAGTVHRKPTPEYPLGKELFRFCIFLKSNF